MPLLRTYSRILNLHRDTFAVIKASEERTTVSLLLVATATLIGGLGKLMGLPALLAQPTPPQQVHLLGEQIRMLERFAVERLPNILPFWIAMWLRMEFIDEFRAEVTGWTARILGVLMQFEVIAGQMAPPLGIGPSRTIRLVGDWLSTPLEVMAGWLLFAFALLVVARLLGGGATLAQHLRLVALAAAPYPLMFFAYLPQPPGALGYTAHLFARLIALIVTVWACAIGVRALAIAHNFAPVRAFWALVLTAILQFVVAPLAIFFLIAYFVL
jgi:hypothetical protein